MTTRPATVPFSIGSEPGELTLCAALHITRLDVTATRIAGVTLTRPLPAMPALLVMTCGKAMRTLLSLS